MVHHLVALRSSPVLLQSHYSPIHIHREMPGKIMLKCSFEQHISSRAVTRHLLSGLAASFVFLSQTSQVVAGDISGHSNVCQLASAADNVLTLPLDEGSDGRRGMMMMMTRGMTAKDFDPIRYSGRWFEVASLKRGFAGQGQEDCHCTQGVYTFDMDTPAIQVDTFCVHGGPDGYITGIRGKVQCLSEEDLEKNETELEKLEMIKEKCYLRFPTLPFIPKEPYDVIATDYDNYALVSGAKDKSFIQIYSRTPVPGPKFIENYKSILANYGYDPSKIKDTPQDCEVMSNSKLAAMMSMNGMQQALTNQFPDLGLKAAVEFNPFTSVFDTLKKLIELYFKL
ncbi:hypothetical protein HYC85_014773 [Camellia sinensis]|uniref:Lipocalin/cytosolic fatty-acid binding domain-containing protein n=1 Tax=Camellia sinensis TaxID=4442 RepID=A0A7J7HAL4_CAMSI|nr:hypothetical protein HYC85_014773 [Camellia sinensis]